MRNSIKKNVLLLSLLTTLSLTGCQVVSVKNQALNVSINNERDSILTGDKLSAASLNVLSMTGREAKICSTDPQVCVSEFKKISQISDEQLLSTASELFLARAIELDKSSACKSSVLAVTHSQEKQSQQKKLQEDCFDQQLIMLDQSIRYSYAYLFKTQRAPQDRLFDNRQVQIRDFYNQAIARLIQTYTVRHSQQTNHQVLRIADSVYHINKSDYPQLQNQQVEQILSTYNMNFSGLRSANRRDGFGSEFLMVLPSLEKDRKPEDSKYIIDPLNHRYPDGINPNIHQARYLAATITAEPKTSHTLQDILTTKEFKLNVYDPYIHEKVKVAGREYSLAANFSAPYGLWLAQNNLGRSAYLSLLDRDMHLTMPHIYMLEPYTPKKKVMVLVHGLASSPEAWIRLTNDIMGDSVLRENYQVWQVFYSTNMPILESHFQIQALIQQSFNSVSKDHPAPQDAVLIGHSMGGIIARLLVSDRDISNEAFQTIRSHRTNALRNNRLFMDRLNIKPIPNFSRAIFIAAPHRGTDFADLWFTKAARKIIKLPGAFLSAFTDTLQGNIDLNDLVQDVGHQLIENGPSDLSKNSRFNLVTRNVKPVSSLKFHSIMGNDSNTEDLSIMTDGVVPYLSAHLEGAQSEKIIKGGHSIQETPEAVLELRRILRLHLDQK